MLAALLPFLPDAVASLGSLILPSVMDIARSKLGGNKTPEDTVASLALTTPEQLPPYVKALAELFVAKSTWFNRDMPNPELVWKWVVSIRAAIRPISVIVAWGVLIYLAASGRGVGADQAVGMRMICETTIGSWMGRIK